MELSRIYFLHPCLFSYLHSELTTLLTTPTSVATPISNR